MEQLKVEIRSCNQFVTHAHSLAEFGALYTDQTGLNQVVKEIPFEQLPFPNPKGLQNTFVRKPVPLAPVQWQTLRGEEGQGWLSPPGKTWEIGSCGPHNSFLPPPQPPRTNKCPGEAKSFHLIRCERAMRTPRFPHPAIHSPLKPVLVDADAGHLKAGSFCSQLEWERITRAQERRLRRKGLAGSPSP